MQIKRFLGNFAKTYLVLGALSVSAYAAADDWSNNCCAPQCAPQCAPCCPTLSCDGPCHEPPCCGYGYNPSAYFTCGNNDCCLSDNLRFEVDFLWWRASSDEVTLGYEEFFDPSTTATGGCCSGSVKQSLSAREPKERFQPGFRLGLDYICPCDGWDAGIFYTHFHSKSKAEGFSELPLAAATNQAFTAFRPLWETVTGDNISPTDETSNGGSVPDFAEGEWILNLDYLDVEIGHKYFVSCRFALRPFIGLRGARINQSYNYDAFADRDVTTTDIGQASNHFHSVMKAKNNFLGAGPRVGLDVQFDVGCGFSLYGAAAGSLLYGRFERHSNEHYTDTTPGLVGPPVAGTTFRFNQHYPSDRTSCAISDLEIGLQWEHCFCWCGKSRPFTLAIGWEHHGFFNLAGFGVNDGTVYYDTVTDTGVAPSSHGTNVKRQQRGDFFTQGLRVAADFAF